MAMRTPGLDPATAVLPSKAFCFSILDLHKMLDLVRPAPELPERRCPEGGILSGHCAWRLSGGLCPSTAGCPRIWTATPRSAAAPPSASACRERAVAGCRSCRRDSTRFRSPCPTDGRACRGCFCGAGRQQLPRPARASARRPPSPSTGRPARSCDAYWLVGHQPGPEDAAQDDRGRGNSAVGVIPRRRDVLYDVIMSFPFCFYESRSYGSKKTVSPSLLDFNIDRDIPKNADLCNSLKMYT